MRSFEVMTGARERSISVVAALVVAAIACGAASAHSSSAQAGAAATTPAQAKQQFVSALTQFLEAAAGAYGDEGELVGRALDSLQAALAAWDGAIRSMQSGLRSDAGVEARFALGVAYLDRLRLDEALREFAAVNKMEGPYAEAHVFSGIAHSLRGRHAEAAAAFAAASRLEPEDPAILYRLAHSLRRTGRIDESTEIYRRFADAQTGKLSQPAAVPGGTAFARVDLLRQVPGAVPIFPPGRYAEGMTALREGRFEEAIGLFRKAATADPLTMTGNAATGRIREGAAALRQGAVSSAIDLFTRAVALEPESSEAHRLAGVAYWADEQYERSIDHLQSAIRLNPGDDRARVALGNVFAASGRVTEAERTLRDAIKVVPASGLAQYRLGRLLYDFPEKWPDATDALDVSLRLYPLIGSDLIYQMLTHMHLVSLSLDAAVEAGTRRIEANPNHAEAYRVLGEAYVQQGRDRDAVPQFLAALLVQPRDAASWAALAQSRLRTGDYAAAESAARRAIQIDPTLGGAQFALANALIRLGRLDDGAKELERFRRMQAEAQARDAREWELKMLNQEASARLQNGEQDEAIAALRTTVALAPEVASGYLSLGAVLKSAGRYAEAVEQFRKAFELSADPAACRLLAESYEALGQADEAAKYTAACVRLKEERVKSGTWRR